MKMKLKLISSSIILGGMMAGISPAYAQSPTILEEIIVTATKRAQNVRDVTSVVNVVGGDEISKLQLLDFEDLERVTSGLVLTQSNPRNATIALRGVTVDPESGTESAVDVYQNNVSQRSDNVFGALYDLDRVEVLKGPQGSVQGATSPGGAIIVHTKKPNLEETEGFVRATFTRGIDGENIQGAVNFPILKDKLAIRIAAYDDQNDRNNVVNVNTGRKQDSDVTSYRASLRWAPTENLDINLVHQNNDQLLYGTPQLVGERAFASAFQGVNVVPCSFAPSGTESCRRFDADDKAAFAGDDSFSAREADITTLNVDWDLGNTTLSYIYGKTDSTKTSRTVNDASNNFPLQQFFYAAALGVRNDTDYLTHQGTVTTVDSDVHEIRWASKDNERWNWMIGGYLRDQDTSTDFEAFTALPFIPLSVGNSPLSPIVFTGGHIEGINFSTGGTIPFNSKTDAIFTAHEFQVSDKTTIEAALRYQEVERFNKTDILFGAFNQPERISIQNLQAISLSPFVPVQFAPFIAGQVLQGTLAAIGSTNIEGVPAEFQNPTDDATTGRFAIKHDFSDNLTSYISYSESFRQGGISITPGESLGVSDLLYNSETSDAIEIGFKGIYLDGRAEVNLALYTQDFDGFLGYVTDLDYVNIQGAVEPLTGGLVFNGDAENKGLELDWRMATSANWMWGGSLSYNDSKFKNAQVPCNIRQPGQQVGRCSSSSRVAGIPELTAVLYGEYNKELSGGMEFYTRANAKYNDGIVATRAVAFGTSAGETPSYMLVDLFMGVRGDKWEAGVFAKNILDDDAELDLSNPGDGFDVNGDFTEINRLRERSFGVTVQYNF